MANIWSCPLVFVFEQSRSWNYTSPSCWPINISFFWEFLAMESLQLYRKSSARVTPSPI